MERWDGTTKTAFLLSPPRTMDVLAHYALGDARTSSWTDLFGRPYPDYTAGRTGTIGRLALGWYSVDPDGRLTTESRTGWRRPDGYERVLENAHRYDLKTEMVVHAVDGQGELEALLADDGAVMRAVRAIAEESRLCDGVQLDFEGLGLTGDEAALGSVRERFNRFVGQLADALHGAGKTLAVAVYPPNGAYRGYDYVTLGELANTIVLMAYDYGPRGTPEPLARVREAVDLTLRAVPREKLLLGIGISAASETGESLTAKIGLAKRAGLRSIALWRLGLMDDARWERLMSMVRPQKESR
ncbi:glycosyl hydrolase family 18 protein [Hydrogenibacillus sp. N12]|uniref:glycosyl hydrolase family 18 protein n=1 Tax=Hydrogenibacillus sp. N12 TaxID=2866627 RepID=UPI001C7DDE39|nr:glycosyl hydrolase family 18 protein [Hydrogenibacillus sp. N12]QZA34039.1 hypothetical protein K2M58_05980 [Hydrogenibacillus sp. N12]